MKKLFDNNLIAIIGISFFAPIFFINFHIGIVTLIHKVIGNAREQDTLGCFKENWMIPVYFFMYTLLFLTIISSAFLVSRKGYKNNSTHLLLLGAFLFYPAASRWVNKIMHLSLGDQLPFLKAKSQLIASPVEVFGNMYNYQWIQFITANLVSILYLILAYYIVFKYWDKKLRIQFFTFGLIACAIGRIFWYQFLEPMIYGK